MPKIICHMQSGYPLTLKSGVLIPGEPAEVSCSEWQAKCIDADCRVIVLDKLPAKPRKAKAEKAKAEETTAESKPAKRSEK